MLMGMALLFTAHNDAESGVMRVRWCLLV